jgi:hypothetical protein
MAKEDSLSYCSSKPKGQETALELLRPFRCELVQRLTSSATKDISEKLYQLTIISHQERDDIQSQNTGTDKARTLVSTMETRSMVDCSQFVGLLQETVGIRDVGTRIVEKIGDHNIQDQLASENLQLKMELSSIKTENQSLTTKLKETKDKVSCSVLRQSASRRTLEVVTGGHYTVILCH